MEDLPSGLGDRCRYPAQLMLNISPIFQYAIDACEEFGDHLNVPPLPTSVYMFQRDVVNHYRHAATHYFPISLDEPYLQNSSIVSPYEKWAKFTNEDFDLLNFACLNLMRYTSRLIYATAYAGLLALDRARETKERCDLLTSAICDLKYNNMKIGIQINANNTTEIFSFGDQIQRESFDIGDRTLLVTLRDNCIREADELDKLNERFGRLSGKLQTGQSPCTPYEPLNESFWV